MRHILKAVWMLLETVKIGSVSVSLKLLNQYNHSTMIQKWFFSAWDLVDVWSSFQHYSSSNFSQFIIGSEQMILSGGVIWDLDWISDMTLHLLFVDCESLIREWNVSLLAARKIYYNVLYSQLHIHRNNRVYRHSPNINIKPVFENFQNAVWVVKIMVYYSGIRILAIFITFNLQSTLYFCSSLKDRLTR